MSIGLKDLFFMKIKIIFVSELFNNNYILQ